MYISAETMGIVGKYIDSTLADTTKSLTERRLIITDLFSTCHEGLRAYYRDFWQLEDCERTEVNLSWDSYIREYLDPSRSYAIYPNTTKENRWD